MSCSILNYRTCNFLTRSTCNLIPNNKTAVTNSLVTVPRAKHIHHNKNSITFAAHWATTCIHNHTHFPGYINESHPTFKNILICFVFQGTCCGALRLVALLTLTPKARRVREGASGRAVQIRTLLYRDQTKRVNKSSRADVDWLLLYCNTGFVKYYVINKLLISLITASTWMGSLLRYMQRKNKIIK